MSLTGQLSGLALPPLLVPIKDLVFNGQAIELDGYRFQNCAFVDCVLHTRSGRFKIEECFFQSNWWAKFDGNALRVLKLASILDWKSVTPEYRAVWHPNGGVSIT